MTGLKNSLCRYSIVSAWIRARIAAERLHILSNVKMRNHKVLLTSSKPQEVPAIQPTILLPSSSIKQQIPATMPPPFLPLYQIYTKPTSSLSQTSASNATQRNTLPPLKHLLRSSQTELHSQRVQNFCHRLTPSSIIQNCFSSRLTPSSIT